MKKYTVKIESWINGEKVGVGSEVLLSDEDAKVLLSNGDVAGLEELLDQVKNPSDEQVGDDK